LTQGDNNVQSHALIFNQSGVKFMISNHTAYLPTDKFYHVPQYEVYTQAKDKHLLTLDPSYSTYDAHQKWPVLMTAFTKALEHSHMPYDLTRQKLQDQLEEFKSKREDTAESENNLSLKQCVNYFENFYFLYTTTNSEYQLRDASKKKFAKRHSRSHGRMRNRHQ